MPALDPVTREIIRGALRAAQTHMEAVIERTAMSPFIREKNDYFAGILDARGRVVCGTMVPLFGNLTQIIFEQYPPATMRPNTAPLERSKEAIVHPSSYPYCLNSTQDGVRRVVRCALCPELSC